ncbi:nicotinamide mononucleotide adenylyltransferase [Xylariaceae sp. FL0804]|nr:nicotinamide mononucleotide adenylyltransferase [Xylariaceae sp. FL0804]
MTSHHHHHNQHQQQQHNHAGLVPPPPPGAPSTMTLDNYVFPTQRLRPQRDPARRPLVLVACGSFSPITYLHLRMFEMAADYARMNTEFEVVGRYLSCVSDSYRKAGLAPAHHRVRMCELAADESPSSGLMVDPWEALQPEYSPTAAVLDHFEHEINGVHGGVPTAAADGDGEVRRPAKIMLLAGADLLSTMCTPGIWADADLDHILGSFGAMIVERNGADLEDALVGLRPWEENIYIIPQGIQNEVSSTKVRLFVKRDMSILYIVPTPVVEYIKQTGLYTEQTFLSLEDAAKSTAKDKQPASKSAD